MRIEINHPNVGKGAVKVTEYISVGDFAIGHVNNAYWATHNYWRIDAFGDDYPFKSQNDAAKVICDIYYEEMDGLLIYFLDTRLKDLGIELGYEE